MYSSLETNDDSLLEATKPSLPSSSKKRHDNKFRLLFLSNSLFLLFSSFAVLFSADSSDHKASKRWLTRGFAQVYVNFNIFIVASLASVAFG
jgi:hypothetical protein